MRPSVLESITKITVVVAALILLAGFFLFPWAQDWARTGFPDIFNNPKVYGEAAYEIAAYAPVLWLIPAGALLAGVIAWIPIKNHRMCRVKWLVILLAGVVIVYSLAWITDAGGVRTLSNPGLKNEFQGTIYFPWNNSIDVQKLVYQYGDVLGGEMVPDHGYYVSLAAGGGIVMCSLLGLLLQRHSAETVQQKSP